MNKKFIFLIIVLIILLVCLSAFFIINNKSENTNNNTNLINNNENSNNSLSENELNSNKRIAIVYFSATGTTKEVAGYIKEATDGELFEIMPKEEYTLDDLDYNNDECRANIEQNDDNARPEIENNIDISNYDVVFLGYPIWWGTLPRIIQTFVESTDLEGKTVIPFCTSGGSGISTSENVLHSYDYNINWIEGKRLIRNETEVINWVNSLEY